MKDYIQESIDLRKKVLTDEKLLASVDSAISALTETLKRGGKVLIAGNGGSAADAQHFAAELVGRYKIERKAYPAIALTTDTSIITAWSNDYSFDGLFARQIEALGQKGDVFIGISTSGNSLNIIQAISRAREIGLKTFALLGKGGGKMKNDASAIIVPSDNTPRIQEIQMMLLHIIAEEVEKNLS